MKILSNILVKAGVIVDNYIAIGTNSPYVGYNIDSRGSHNFGNTSTEVYHYFQSSNVSGGSTLSVYTNNTSANSSRSHIMLADTLASVPTRFGLGVYTGEVPYAYLDSASKLVFNNASQSNVIIGTTVDNGYKLQVNGDVTAGVFRGANGAPLVSFDAATNRIKVDGQGYGTTVGNSLIVSDYISVESRAAFNGNIKAKGTNNTITYGIARPDAPALDSVSIAGMGPLFSNPWYTGLGLSFYVSQSADISSGGGIVEKFRIDPNGDITAFNLAGTGTRMVVVNSSGVLSTQSVSSSSNAFEEYTYTATAGQTTFSATYTVGQLAVFYNGAKLEPIEYTATNGTSVVLSFSAMDGDIVDILAYQTGAGIALTSLSATGPLVYNNTTGAFSIQQASGSQAGYLSSADWSTFNNKVSSQWTTSGSNIYYNSGNVGIGTSAPVLTGANRTTVDISGSSQSLLVLSTGSTWKSYFYNDGTNLSIANNGGFINFDIGGEKLRINSTGVGVGTSSPNAKLEVLDASTSSGEVARFQRNIDAINEYAYIRVGNASYPAYFGSMLGTYDVAYMSMTEDPTLAKGIYVRTVDGNVGVGVTNPQAALHVAGKTGVGNTLRLTAYDNSGDNWIGFYLNNGVRQGYMGYGYSASNIMEMYQEANDPIIFSTNALERLRIAANGDITLGVTPAYDSAIIWRDSFTSTIRGRIYSDGTPRVHVRSGESGGVYLSSGATSWTANSDERLKDINSHITNAVDKIIALRAVNFSWKSDPSKNENIGLIAQDVKAVLPQLVDEDKEGIMGVRYTELVPVLVAAIQEQQTEIESLKAQLGTN